MYNNTKNIPYGFYYVFIQTIIIITEHENDKM